MLVVKTRGYNFIILECNNVLRHHGIRVCLQRGKGKE